MKILHFIRDCALVTSACLILAPTRMAAAAETYSVDVLSIVEHPALDSIREGVRDQLEAEGFSIGQNLKWEYQSAQGSVATASQIARKYVGDQPNAIVAIATPAAQAVAAATHSVPLVFAGVTDPVAAQLVKSFGPSGTNITGVSDRLPLERQIDLILKIVPHAKRIGMVYSPGEANSVVVVNQLKQLLEQRGMTLVESAAARTVDVGPAARNQAGKVDVIYTSTDNNVVSAYESLARVANEAKIPLIASDTGSVKRGAIAALGQNYYQFGRQTGKIVAQILHGTKPGAIAIATSDQLELAINPSAAARQGVTLPPQLLAEAKQTFK